MNFQQGLAALDKLITPEDGDDWRDFQLFRARLESSLARERRFGVTPLTQASVFEVVDQLNPLALRFAGRSFVDLSLDPTRRLDLRLVPVPPDPGAAEHGPDIQLRDPPSDLELQSWFQREPGFQDVGFLRRAVARAASVCRVEVPGAQRLGTGFLVGPDLVLTNYHVLRFRPDEDLEDNARATVLRFGHITSDGEQPLKGQTFRLADPTPVVDASATAELDYVLLRVEASIAKATDVSPSPLSLQPPTRGMGLHILQHPRGEPLQLAVSQDAVTGVYADAGVLQYVTRAESGSSGAPCFDDDWRVVALHHAQRSRSFGSVREGILISRIHDRIKGHL